MSVSHNTRPKDIMAWWNSRHAGRMEYHAAYRVLRNILGDALDEQIRQFALLPAYIRRIEQEDIGSYTRLKLVGTRFSSLFIAPSFCRQAWQHLRPVVCVDAAFTKTLLDYVLIIACGIDANQQGINLAWGIVPKENGLHWEWFLENLKEAFPTMNCGTTILMSDRQKGLHRAVPRQLGRVQHAFCCKHIECNLVKQYGKEIVAPYWAVAKAKSQPLFQIALGELSAINER